MALTIKAMAFLINQVSRLITKAYRLSMNEIFLIYFLILLSFGRDKRGVNGKYFWINSGK
jgi:hypothetical protein